MNVLMVGSGKGSWAMRGQQLGAALGARVLSQPTEADLHWADVVVLIKRAGLQFCRDVQRIGKPIVWDALDFWKQPAENRLTEIEAVRRLNAEAAIVKPALTIGATQAMAQAVTASPAAYVPHHSWSGLVPTAPREHVSVVAYEGNPVYLGAWLPVLQKACAARGWMFAVNPPDLSKVDILVALREGPWDGWICREWKSGVKLVNALAAGRPVLTQASAAWREVQPVGSVIAGSGDVSTALDLWADLEARRETARLSQTTAYTLSTVADSYRTILAGVLKGESCAA